jgi:predicted nuclease of restriction endonuclease-like (RecB) superfamily
MSLSYIEDDINVSFHIEFLDFGDITYKEFKQESRCNSYLGQFLYETGFGHLYLIRVYGDF